MELGRRENHQVSNWNMYRIKFLFTASYSWIILWMKFSIPEKGKSRNTWKLLWSHTSPTYLFPLLPPIPPHCTVKANKVYFVKKREKLSWYIKCIISFFFCCFSCATSISCHTREDSRNIALRDSNLCFNLDDINYTMLCFYAANLSLSQEVST